MAVKKLLNSSKHIFLFPPVKKCSEATQVDRQHIDSSASVHLPANQRREVRSALNMFQHDHWNPKKLLTWDILGFLWIIIFRRQAQRLRIASRNSSFFSEGEGPTDFGSGHLGPGANGGFLSHGGMPNSWMVFGRENPI